jgi:hypothetical protein
VSLLVGTVSLSIAGGSALYLLGAGPYIDTQLGSHIPLHQSLAQIKLGFWNQPERGIMAGLVTDIATTGESFTLQTPDSVEHVIRTDSLSQEVRDEIEIGTAMRVVAPRQNRSSGAPVMAKTSLREDVSTVGGVMPRDARMKSAPAPFSAANDNAEVQDEDTAEIREACLVMPLDFANSSTRGQKLRTVKTEIRDKCFKEIRERKRGRGED